MSYFVICPDCGANLDPGEQCDCKRERECIERKASTAPVYTRAHSLPQHVLALGMPRPIKRT